MGATKAAALILECDGPHVEKQIFTDTEIWSAEKRARECGWRIGAHKVLCPQCMGMMKPEQLALFDEEAQ